MTQSTQKAGVIPTATRAAVTAEALWVANSYSGRERGLKQTTENAAARHNDQAQRERGLSHRRVVLASCRRASGARDARRNNRGMRSTSVLGRARSGKT